VIVLISLQTGGLGVTKVRWVGVVGLTLWSCGSDPGYEPRSSRQDIVVDDHPKAAVSVEAPRTTVDAMQICADRFAPKLRGESFAVLFDVNVGVNGNTVKVKDSMLGGSPLESCLASAFERMEISDSIANMQQTSASSRSMVGIVQAVAAPIALLPIALAAAGVTILVGATIHLATEALKERERCKKVKQGCIEDCSDDTLDDGFHEPMFTRCVRSCMEQANCR